jgi:hypothetical protein
VTGRITIGRFGLDLDTTELDTWSVSDGRVQVSGELFFATVAEALAARQQICGLVEYPDPVYVAWADDSTQDGFYRVVGASVPTGELTLVSGLLPWSVTLERSRGYAGLRPELATNFKVRSAVALFSSVASVGLGIPSDYAKDYGGATTTTTTRNLIGGGTVDIVYPTTTMPRVTLAGPASLTYNGAAKIRMGSTMYAVIGRQTTNLTTAWELSNGIVTVTPPSTGTGLFRVQTATSAGAAASVTYELKLGRYTGGAYSDVTSVTQDSVVVIRESIESCALRIMGRVTASSVVYTYTLDLILNRGDRGVTATFTSNGSLQWGAAWTSSVTSSLIGTLDNALEANSADADGNKAILIVHDPEDGAGTHDTAGKVWIDAARTSISIFCASSCSGTGNAVTLVAGNFFYITEARQRMVHP